MRQDQLEEWWITCPKFTVRVATRGGIITCAAPVVKAFEGQHMDNLKRWLSRFGQVRIERLHGRRPQGGSGVG